MEIDAEQLVERIKQHTTVYSLKKIGISPSTVYSWKSDGAIPKSELVLKIADFLGVSVDWLLTGKEDKNLSDDELVFITAYRKLPDNLKKVAEAQLQALLNA